MTEYALYVESGPKQRKTQVHVLDLLGCIAQGPTTEEALGAAPGAIREYLRFLKRHGEPVDPEGDFTAVVAEHVMKGMFLGQGDPTPGFRPDFQPLSSDDLHTYLRRLNWMQDELVALVRDLSPAQLAAKPQAGRAIYHILAHVAGAHAAYVRSTVGKVEGLTAAGKRVEQGPEAIPFALVDMWQIAGERLEAMSEMERTQLVPHGQVTWTARRGLRRMLEHNWEHLQEISKRLAGEASSDD